MDSLRPFRPKPLRDSRIEEKQGECREKNIEQDGSVIEHAVNLIQPENIRQESTKERNRLPMVFQLIDGMFKGHIK